MRKTSAAIAAAITLACTTALAHGPARAPRYSVQEIRPPAAMLAPCLANYRNSAAARINDLGVVAGTFTCTAQFDPATGSSTLAGGPFVWSSWFGGLELRDGDPATCCSFAASINNRGEVFGSDVGPPFVGVKWSLAGGFETVFPNDPTCDIIKLDIAIAGNGRYTVGTGFRADPNLPIPGLCLAPSWITRAPSGAITTSLLNAEPRDINAFNMGVGVLERDRAIRLHVPSGALYILHTGNALEPALTTDINDLGEVSGYQDFLDPDPRPGVCPVLTSSALRWDRNDRETVLPHLPGATASRALQVGYDGETVGQSGPGQVCEPQLSTNERAVLWRGDKPLDLNTAIAPHLGVTLASAHSINRRGQIVALGHRNDDPQVICPVSVFDPQTGQTTVDVSQLCRYQRVYVLTPH
jgi:uncharacterized membrane protein